MEPEVLPQTIKDRINFQISKPDKPFGKGLAQIFMFGVPIEGSMSAFATILNGYSLTEGTHKPRHLLRKLSRQDAFSGLSVFQLMPHKGTARFLDQNLKPVTVDLYDPVNWKLYGWSSRMIRNLENALHAKNLCLN